MLGLVHGVRLLVLSLVAWRRLALIELSSVMRATATAVAMTVVEMVTKVKEGGLRCHNISF